MRGLNCRCVVTAFFLACGVAVPLTAQTSADQPAAVESGPASPALGRPDEIVFVTRIDFSQVIQPPAGPPPTPRHTGIKAMLTGIVIDVKHLPSKENLMWAGIGGGLALAVHPLDDNINHKLVGNDAAENFFKAGEVLGELPTLLATSSVVYAVGRIRDQPRVSHVGMDLIQSLVISEGLTQTLKYTTRRERPDHSGKNSFPSGHAADTFAFATALERHLGWRYAVPAYVFASYVAVSRLPANRHWFSDAVFGASVGIIAGRTVTSQEAHPFPVAVVHVPDGMAVMYVHRGK
jgi:membrane-associated phospholipid phosphatase